MSENRVIDEINTLTYINDIVMYGENGFIKDDAICDEISASEMLKKHTAAFEILSEYILSRSNKAGYRLANMCGLNHATFDSLQTIAAIIANSTAMAAVAGNRTAMAAVVASSTAIAAVTVSSTAMGKIAASSVAITAVTASTVAMNAIAESSTAMTAIAASSAAMTAIENSVTACNALASSPLIVTKTGLSFTKVVQTAYSGKCFVVSAMQTAVMNSSYYLYVGNRVIGGGEINVGAFTVTYENYKSVGKFVNPLVYRNDYSSLGNYFCVKYIPC